MKKELAVTICIPTYKRLDLLTKAIESCLAQTHLPYEILIGDNSPGTDTQQLVEALAQKATVPLRYFHHVPGLSQPQNVDYLFGQVQSDILLLLHDDDTLENSCLANMVACFRAHLDIDVLFGKQYLMSHQGVINHELSTQINQTFYRTDSYVGDKLSGLESAILQQFPNDCYAIRTDLAKKMRYSSNSNHACDFEFALRLGLANAKTYFLNEYTASYRLSDDALSNDSDNNGALIIFQSVEPLDMPAESRQYQQKVLKEKAPVAIAQAARLKQGREAARILLGKWYRGRLLTVGGIKSILHVMRAFS
jgi:glycosyltransferase involved in cell wall biosynthesis